MQQRYYDPLVGRFLSTDPVGPESDPLNHFGRYHYAYNNPYGFTDPDGRVGKKVATLIRLLSNGMHKEGKRLTQEAAVRIRQQGGNVKADREQVARQIEVAANKGKEGVMKHKAMICRMRIKVCHFTNPKEKTGHTFYQVVGAALLLGSNALSNAADAAEVADPMIFTSPAPELENHERNWFGAYERIDPNGLTYGEARQKKQAEDKERYEKNNKTDKKK
jgi:uncharacterized protein RhaS with RHS repeats